MATRLHRRLKDGFTDAQTHLLRVKLAKAIDLNGECLGKVAEKVSFGRIKAAYSGFTKACSPDTKPGEILGVIKLLERIEKHHLKLAQDASKKRREQ